MVTCPLFAVTLKKLHNCIFLHFVDFVEALHGTNIMNIKQ